MVNNPGVPEKLVPKETPTGKVAKELAREESELLIPAEEDALLNELPSGGAPESKGGLDMIRNLTL